MICLIIVHNFQSNKNDTTQSLMLEFLNVSKTIATTAIPKSEIVPDFSFRLSQWPLSR